jgi:hypothetical protein
VGLNQFIGSSLPFELNDAVGNYIDVKFSAVVF